MTDRNDRSDRLRKRFERDESGGSESDSDETTSGETSPSASEAESASIKDRPSVLMYLPEEIHGELDVRFDELNARYKREHGEALEKNRDYYPAVIQAGLEDRSVEDILEL